MKTIHLKITFIVFTMCIVAVVISACGNTVESQEDVIVDSEHLMSYLCFEDLVGLSDSAILGEYVETITYDNYVEHCFKVSNVYYGDVQDEQIYLYSNKGKAYVEKINYEYELDYCPYEAGKQYILIMDKYSSIMFTHDRYVTGAELLICPEDGVCSMYSEPVSINKNMTVADYIVTLPNSYLPAQMDVAKVYNNETERAVANAEYVAKINVCELYFESEIHNGNTYLCDAELLYKGSELNLREDGKILLVMLKDTVEVGGEYIVCFSKVSENSVIYTQQTKDSVLEATADIESAIKSYIE